MTLASVNERITKAMARDKLKAFVHVTRKGPHISDVLCKVCAAKIIGLVPDDRFRESQKINGQVVIRERLLTAQLPQYAEVQLIMDNGGRHITNCCANCIDFILAMKPEDLEDLYAADLQELLNEGGDTGYLQGIIGSVRPVRAEVVG